MNPETAYFPNVLTGTTGEIASVQYAPKAPSQSVGDAQSRNGTLERHTGAYTAISEASDELLLKLIRDGEREALALLFRRHARSVRNVAYRILRDEAEADDLVQEVFLWLFQKAKLFDASKGTAVSWIIQIAYHRAINRRRYLIVRQHYDAPTIDESQIASNRQHLFIDEIVARALLDRCREQLSQEQLYTLELHFFEGYTLREIADKTRQTLGNVRHHYYRGLEQLRSLLFPPIGT
jgi:RNA polymerase sigma-70 factor (ECF subfamily)